MARRTRREVLSRAVRESDKAREREGKRVARRTKLADCNERRSAAAEQRERACADCGRQLGKNAFSEKQRGKRARERRRRERAEQNERSVDARRAEAAAHWELECAGCKRQFGRSAFSEKQLAKLTSERRCRECAQENEGGVNGARASAAALRELRCAARGEYVPWQAHVARGQRNYHLKKRGQRCVRGVHGERVHSAVVASMSVLGQLRGVVAVE